MSDIADFVQLKNGQYINGSIDVSIFTIKTPYGTLRVRKKDILNITYKNPPYFLADEAKLSAGTRIEGDILPAVIPVRVEGEGPALRIPKKDIHTLVFFLGRKRSISTATRRRVAGLK